MTEEKNYLDKTINAINRQINDLSVRLLEEKKEKEETKDQITSNFYDMDNEELSRQKTTLDETEREEDLILKTKNRLEFQINRPYFARIDFTPQNEEKEKLYIGLGFVNDKNSPLVYDWRAPVSSMYYEFETGSASYNCDDGKICGNIELKRQYIIENQKLKSYIDTSETINDKLLQEVLSKNSSAKMKEIVSTIQKEQNKLIRIDDNKNILVQGVAGSGKTSIALHRAAYLLYKNKDSFKSTDIFILSPTTLFSNYISEVLPELGEQATSGATFLTLAKTELNKKIQTRDVLVDILEQNKNSKILNEIAYKASFSFVEDLRRFLEKTITKSFTPKDLSFKTRKSEKPLFFFSKDEIKYLYFTTYKNMPISKRISYIAENLIERFNLRKNEFLPIKERFSKFLYDFFPTTDLQEILNLFFLSKGISQNDDDIYRYEDIPALLMIKDYVFGLNLNIPTKYLIIDEMQDFTPAHFYLLEKIFPCPKLVLGDINQCIEKSLSTDYLKKLTKFLNAEMFYLNKTYRSTKQISTFCQNIIGLKDAINLNREGENPDLIKTQNEIEEIIKLIELNSLNYEHIAVIAKTSQEAQALANELGNVLNIQVLTDSDTEIKSKIIVTTPTTSKGVEFDYVIIPNCSDKNYHDALDRNLLYISTTRALHKLSILYTQKPSKFLK